MDEDGGSVRLKLIADQVAPTLYTMNVTLMDGNAICKYSARYICVHIILYVLIQYKTTLLYLILTAMHTVKEDYLTESRSREVIAAFAEGATEVFVEVDIIDDFFLERDEQFKARISIPGSAPDTVQVGANNEATVTIVDNEQEISVSFNPVVYNYNEADGVATLTLVASAPVEVDYEVYVDTRDGTALCK